jgi:hypothetical protein
MFFQENIWNTINKVATKLATFNTNREGSIDLGII